MQIGTVLRGSQAYVTAQVKTPTLYNLGEVSSNRITGIS